MEIDVPRDPGIQLGPALAESLLTSAVSGLSALDVQCRIMQQRARQNPSRLRGPARRDGSPMRDYPPITELVMRARNGDQQAWM